MGCGGSREKAKDTPQIWSNHLDRSSQSKYNFKIVFLGKSGVGKTSITIRFCRDTFFDGTEATIGASFLTKTMNIDNRTIKFELWDTAGQERYRALAPMYYRNADAAVLVFDYTDPDSFQSLQSWLYEIQKNVPDCVIILCGNKIDLESSRKVQHEAAEDYAKENDCLLIEVSSKTGQNIQELFTKLGELLSYKHYKT
ncbi:ras-related protein Rab-5A-like [Schistocerca gregaria]|uniref:ras-related protein Rab-5A-like n=1 Tax=Schistocerca gregaria TaxID=7010 RepID=UPI00211EAD10|nr:ras-related protein Rab-5A-like [Schistocerca gregaria]